MACECDGFARQSSKLLDKVRFLGELLFNNGVSWRGALTGIAAELKPQCLWVRVPPALLLIIWVDWTWESKLSVKQSLLDEQWRFDSFSAH